MEKTNTGYTVIPGYLSDNGTEYKYPFAEYNINNSMIYERGNAINIHMARTYLRSLVRPANVGVPVSVACYATKPEQSGKVC